MPLTGAQRQARYQARLDQEARAHALAGMMTFPAALAAHHGDLDGKVPADLDMELAEVLHPMMIRHGITTTSSSPVLRLLGGRAYVEAILEWGRADWQWRATEKTMRGARPTPPPRPGRW